MSRVADKASAARKRLVDWGVDVPNNDRLTQAIGVLREAARTGNIPPAEDGVAPVLRAAWIAADFSDIASLLPDKRVKSVRVELGIACKGDLWPARGARQPLQFQSQHWIAAIVSHTGIHTEHAYASTKRPVKIPEFFVHRGAERVAVEVKRPEVENGIVPAIEDCKAKFSDHPDCWGAIVLELTDCILPTPQERFQIRAQELLRIAHQVVWDTKNTHPRSGFERLIYLGAVFRGAWAIAGPSGARLQLMGTAMHQSYGGLPSSRQEELSDWFREEANGWYNGVITRLSE